MFWMIRTVFALMIFGLAAYAFFGVDMGGKTLFAHTMDMWRSPTVQQKRTLVHDSAGAWVKQKVTARIHDALDEGEPQKLERNNIDDAGENTHANKPSFDAKRLMALARRFGLLKDGTRETAAATAEDLPEEISEADRKALQAFLEAENNQP